MVQKERPGCWGVIAGCFGLRAPMVAVTPYGGSGLRQEEFKATTKESIAHQTPDALDHVISELKGKNQSPSERNPVYIKFQDQQQKNHECELGVCHEWIGRDYIEFYYVNAISGPFIGERWLLKYRKDEKEVEVYKPTKKRAWDQVDVDIISDSTHCLVPLRKAIERGAEATIGGKTFQIPPYEYPVGGKTEDGKPPLQPGKKVNVDKQ